MFTKHEGILKLFKIGYFDLFFEKIKSPIFKIIFEYFSDKKFQIAIAFFLVMVAKASGLIVPYILKIIIDSQATEIGYNLSIVALTSIIVVYVFFLVTTTILDELKSVVAEIIVQPAVAHIGEVLFKALMMQSQDDLISRSYGELTREIDRGLKSLQSLVALTIHTIIPLVFELSIVILFSLYFYEFYSAILIVGLSSPLFMYQ
jgi:ABC-type multidrug transport system fused ATPase/permease subunit